MIRRTRLAALASVGPLAALAAHDALQRRHAILRNFPVVGHARFVLETAGPGLRQYIVAANDEERPFSRDQRRWVYASSKGQQNTFGFGTDNELDAVEALTVLKQESFPAAPPAQGTPGSGPEYLLPSAKVLGGARGRRHAFRPLSVVNTSAMSYGSLSGPAVEAINRGAALAPCLQNTGEGGLSPSHRHGGELIFQIGTGYFGCRTPDGAFSLDELRARIDEAPIRALEIKLSQGAKPGLGGMLPAAKVTEEIARIRGVRAGEDCISPAQHTAFSGVDGLIAFVEHLAEETGLPVGVKSAVGAIGFWEELAARMAATGSGPDFVTVDGGEGGTGAAPLAFSDHVALPFRVGFSRVFATFAEQGLTDDVVFVGAGRLGFPDSAVFAFALGCDMINVGREAMLAVGCIQAQQCHTGRCPTGVATQDRWLMRGLDPDLKSARAANYVRALRAEILSLSRALGVPHPSLVHPDQLEILSERYRSATVTDVFGLDPEWRRPSPQRRREIESIIGTGDHKPTPGPEGGPVPGDGSEAGQGPGTHLPDPPRSRRRR
jgi:hypothetical protein